MSNMAVERKVGVTVGGGASLSAFTGPGRFSPGWTGTTVTIDALTMFAIFSLPVETFCIEGKGIRKTMPVGSPSTRPDWHLARSLRMMGLISN